MSVPIEKLLAVKTIVVHSNCPDGLASAMILDDVLPGREIIFAVHKVTKLEPKPNTLFCDICPPEDQVEEFRAAGAIVLDHHKGYRGAQEVITRSFEYHAFGDENKDPGVSGAVLAYRHVWKPLYEALALHPDGAPSGYADRYDPVAVEHFAVLAGIRDTWQTKSFVWQEACAQAEMLLFYPRTCWIYPDQPPRLLRTDKGVELAGRMEVGRIALQSKLAGSKRLAEHADYFASPKGVKVAILSARYVSDAADMVAADFCVGFSFTVESGKQKMLLSTRSRGSYDSTAFCHFYGGGGHTKAAGCTIDIEPGDLNPYALIRSLIERFETDAHLPVRDNERPIREERG